MAYFVEWGLVWGEGLYAEFVFKDVVSGALLAGDGIDHQLSILDAYLPGDNLGGTLQAQQGQIVASNTGGGIFTPERGLVVMNVPGSTFAGLASGGGGCGWDYGRPGGRIGATLRCQLLAVPPDPSFTKTILTGTITFGDRGMASPRVTLQAYPIYPGTMSSPPSVAQVKAQLSSLGAYDKVEAALTGGPTSAATIAWNTGGDINPTGPLATLIATTLGIAPQGMATLLANASSILL